METEEGSKPQLIFKQHLHADMTEHQTNCKFMVSFAPWFECLALLIGLLHQFIHSHSK